MRAGLRVDISLTSNRGDMARRRARCGRDPRQDLPIAFVRRALVYGNNDVADLHTGCSSDGVNTDHNQIIAGPLQR